MRLRAWHLQSVEPARVVVENFFLDGIADETIGAKNINSVDFARGVRMSVVGADNDIVFAGVAQDVTEVVVGFGGHVDVEFFERQLGKSFAAAAPDRFLDHPWDPLGRCLDEGPAQLDRKSTRLNSSHPSISYAVFCLKKKKQTDLEGGVLKNAVNIHAVVAEALEVLGELVSLAGKRGRLCLEVAGVDKQRVAIWV